MSMPMDLFVTMSDGVELAVRVHLPEGKTGPFPALFGASPYRFDNDILPETKMFLWLETGPIHWYLEQGYAYVRLDVRGTGRSGGEYRFFDRRERRDLYEVIEWIAVQEWCSGKVGGIGESYYGTSQWFMAAEKPPHLACIAPYDGHIDLYDGWAYNGGIPGNFMSLWWNSTVRQINRRPGGGGPPKLINYDLCYELDQHPNRDGFWSDRALLPQLESVDIPVFSIGIWAKMDLHLAGNIAGWRAVKGPKWLQITGAINAFEACADFEHVDFHRNVLLPFYDRYLKGADNGFENKSPVEVFVRNTGAYENLPVWPPAAAGERVFWLGDARSNTVQSLNDGALETGAPSGALSATSYDYPRAAWTIGVATLDEKGPDPLREILTFTSAPFENAFKIAGPGEAVIHLSSTAPDTDLIIRLSEVPAPGSGKRPAVITKGWLRVAHRALDMEKSRPLAPVHDHSRDVAIPRGEVVECRVALVDAAYLVPRGSRLRLEIANGDSGITDPIFSHVYSPDKVGRDTIHHDARYPSRLALSVEEAGR